MSEHDFIENFDGSVECCKCGFGFGSHTDFKNFLDIYSKLYPEYLECSEERIRITVIR